MYKSILIRTKNKNVSLIDIYDNSNINLLMDGENIKSIVCGLDHYIVYKINGNLIGFGYPECDNDNERDNKTNNKLILVGKGNIILNDFSLYNTNIIKNIKNISCGSNYSLINENNGDLSILGYFTTTMNTLSDYRKCDKSIFTKNHQEIKFMRSSRSYFIIYKNNGDIIKYGLSYCGKYQYYDQSILNEPILIMNDKNIKFIECSVSFSIFYKYNGDLLVLGNNDFRQLGLDNIKKVLEPTLLMNDPNIRSISCGHKHMIIHKYNGDIFGYGDNRKGQLGSYNKKINYILITNDPNIKTVICGQYHTLFYKYNGDLILLGYDKPKKIKYTLDNPLILMNDPSIIQIDNIHIKFDWSPINHKYFSDNFKCQVKILYKCLMYMRNLFKIRIPKYIVYEFIEYIL